MESAALGAMVMIFVAMTIVVLMRPAYFICDDAYFYLVAAKHLALGDGSTFNGFSRTNGYHPLWMYVSAFVYFFLRPSSTMYVAILVILNSGMFVTAVLVVRQILLRAAPRASTYWWLSLPVLVPFFFATVLSEGPLNSLVFSAFFLFCVKASGGDRSLRTLRITSLLAGISIVTRLDDVFVVTFLLSVPVLIDAKNAAWRRAVLTALNLGGGVFLVLGPYLIWNYISFGHLMPISGAIKTPLESFNFPMDLHRLGPWGWRFTTAAFVVGVSAGLWRSMPLRGSILAACIGGLIHSLYVLFAMGATFTQWSWYHVPEAIIFAISFPILAQKVIDAATVKFAIPYKFALSALIVIVFVSAFSVPVRKYYRVTTAEPNWWEFAQSIGEWVRNSTPSDARIMVDDLPGAIAYYSDRAVICADGLVSDYEYVEHVKKLGIVDYLRNKHIEYFIGGNPAIFGAPFDADQSRQFGSIRNFTDWPSQQVVRFFSPLGGDAVGSVDLRNATRIAIFSFDGIPHKAIWSIPAS